MAGVVAPAGCEQNKRQEGRDFRSRFGTGIGYSSGAIIRMVLYTGTPVRL